MNKYQKLVQQQFINDEETVIKRLRSIYNQSYKDINKNIVNLNSSISALQKALADIGEDGIGDIAAAYFKSNPHITPEEAKETLQSRIQSKVYQKNYQKALQKQVDGVLDNMYHGQYKTISDYLELCYENGFIGTMYDLQGQGIPLCFPLDQEAMVRAVQLDSKISKGLYQKLGEDVAVLKKKIAAQVSRGIATGMTYDQVALQLSGTTNIGFNNAVRIARTEGHRIQCQSGMDACYKAKEKGADVLKQWDATLDGKTRESHSQVDGEIRELDETFSNGLKYPGDPSGGAAEVVNCRCALLQRAKWALDEAELKVLQDRASFYGLDKTANFEDYKKKYLQAVNKSEPKKSYNEDDTDKIIFKEASTIKEAEKYAQSLGVKKVSYKGADINTANAMNKSLTNALNYCPEIRDNMNFYGVTQERNKLMKADFEAYYNKKYRAMMPGYSDKQYAAWAKSAASKTVGKVGSDNLATAFSGKCSSSDKEAVEIIRRYSGIGVNGKAAKDSAQFLRDLAYSTKTKFHPIGCDTIESVFDHEFGHQIDYLLDIRNSPEIKTAWNEFLSLSNTTRDDMLSRYAYRDGKIAEFIAEGYSEYKNSSTPRKYATIIGEFIEKKVKGNG